MKIYVLLREKKTELGSIWSIDRVTTNYNEIQEDLEFLKDVFRCKVEVWENSAYIETINYN